MLLGLATKFSLHLADVHAVGFSLGAHVAALSSNGLSMASGSRLGRITGTEQNVTCVVLIASRDILLTFVKAYMHFSQ
jgi:hypothetical protein